MKRMIVAIVISFSFAILFSMFFDNLNNPNYALNDKLSNSEILDGPTDDIIATSSDIHFDFGESIVSNTSDIYCKLLYDFDDVPLIKASGNIGFELLNSTINEARIKLSLIDTDGFLTVYLDNNQEEYDIKLYSSFYSENGIDTYGISTLSTYHAWELAGFIDDLDYLDNDTIEATYVETQEINDRSTGYIYGYLNWMDDTSLTHPLVGAMVKITYSGSITGIYTITDSNGYFSIQYEDIYGNNGFQCWIHVYSKNQHVEVKNGASQNPNVYEYAEELFLGNNTNYNFNKNFYTDNAFRDALCIFEALNFYSDYVLTNLENSIPFCSLIYYNNLGDVPLDLEHDSYIGSDYSNTLIRLYFNRVYAYMFPVFNLWDTIGHEYGHHLEYFYFDFDYCYDSNWPGYSNISNQHSIDNNGIYNVYQYNLNYGNDNYFLKKYGANMSFGEAWASFFAIYAQDYFPYEFKLLCRLDEYNFIVTVFKSVNLKSLSNGNLLNSGKCDGETDEVIIMAILYRMWESNNLASWDNLSIGDDDLWYIMTEYNPQNLSEFVNYLYTDFNVIFNRDHLGSILEIFEISPSNIRVEREACYTEPVTVKWDANGKSVLLNDLRHFENNKFTIGVYNSNDLLLVEKTNLLTNQYTFTQSEWHLITYGAINCNYYIRVYAYSTLGYETGLYPSDLYNFYYDGDSEYSITIGNQNYYEKEFTIFEESTFTFDIYSTTSGYRLIQTFGSCDTNMRLYNANGTIYIDGDYNNGYNYNSLIYVNLSAYTNYKLVIVSSYASEVDFAKLVIIPTLGDLASGSLTIDEYDDVYQIPIGNTYCNTTVTDGYSTILLWRPSISGYYDISLSSDFDNELYVLNPTSSYEVVYDVDYNYDYCIDEDNGTYTSDAGLYGYYSSSLTYFIVIGKSNPYENGGFVSIVFYRYNT